jgi:hypothetical protein
MTTRKGARAHPTTSDETRTLTAASWPYRFDVLPLSTLFIDETYQRPLSRFVKKLADNFDPALLGCLIVSDRDTGNGVDNATGYAVIDGQTRLMALRQLGHLNAPCLIYTGLSREEEADLFARFQSERKNVSALERYRAALVAREPRAIDISDLADRAGFVVDKSNVGNSIVAIKALEETYDRYGADMVARVLDVVAGAWKFRHAGANTNEILRGLAYFLARNTVDDDRLIRRLSIVDPATLQTRASQLRQGRGHGGKSPGYMAEAISVEYRRRRATEPTA